jgi:hypothetical protein
MNDDSNDGFGDIEARSNAKLNEITPATEITVFDYGKIKSKTKSNEAWNKNDESFGDVALDIDIYVYDFCSDHTSAMQELIKRCVSTTPEITFLIFTIARIFYPLEPRE